MIFIKNILFILLLAISVGSFSFSAMAAGGGGEEHPEGVPYFIELDPLIVPIMTNSKRFEVIAINLVLEAENSEHSSKITESVPRLRDGFIRSLYGRLHEDSLIDNAGVLNTQRLKDRLMAVANHVLEHGEVQDILLQGVTHQRMR